MIRYEDYKKDKSRLDLTKEELESIPWTKYKILVPTERDRIEVLEALKHFHNSDIDTDFVTVNQLSHEYLAMNDHEGKFNVFVDPSAFRDKHTVSGMDSDGHFVSCDLYDRERTWEILTEDIQDGDYYQNSFDDEPEYNLPEDSRDYDVNTLSDDDWYKMISSFDQRGTFSVS